MKHWIMGIVVAMLLGGCAPQFETDLASMERSFDEQRSAVARNDGAAFIRSLDKLPQLMKRTMDAVDDLPLAEQMPAALRFAQVGDQGEKLYYSKDFRRFMDGELQSNGDADRVKAIFERFESLNLKEWMASKRSMSE